MHQQIHSLPAVFCLFYDLVNNQNQVYVPGTLYTVMSMSTGSRILTFNLLDPVNLNKWSLALIHLITPETHYMFVVF